MAALLLGAGGVAYAQPPPRSDSATVTGPRTLAEAFAWPGEISVVRVGPAAPGGRWVERQEVPRAVSGAASGPARAGAVRVLIALTPAQSATLREGSYILAPLAPLEVKAGGGDEADSPRWRYHLNRAAPLEVPDGEARPTARFVERWKGGPPAGSRARLEALVAALSHPATLVRALGFESLEAESDVLSVMVDETLLARLAGILVDPGHREEDRVLVASLLPRLGGDSGANTLARTLPRMAVGSRLRVRALSALARHPTSEGRAALRACLADPGDRLAATCARLLSVSLVKGEGGAPGDPPETAPSPPPRGGR